MRSFLTATILAVLATSACTNSRTPPIPATGMLAVAADDGAAFDGKDATPFRLATVRQVAVRLRTPQLAPGVNWVTLRVYAPDGTLYDTRHLAYSTNRSITQTESPDGVPHPIDVLPARPVAGGFELDTFVQVAGTIMQRRALVGTWKLVASLDAQQDVHPETQMKLQ